MDDTMKAVKAYDWGQTRVPLLEIDREIRNVYGHPEHLAKLEENLLEVLNSDASLASKRFVCQKLGVIGGEHSVRVLAAMLTNPETSDIARYALERIPADIVDKAFRAALNSTSGKTKVGIIDSIGMRKDREATASLGPLLADADPMIATTAPSARWVKSAARRPSNNCRKPKTRPGATCGWRFCTRIWPARNSRVPTATNCRPLRFTTT